MKKHTRLSPLVLLLAVSYTSLALAANDSQDEQSLASQASLASVAARVTAAELSQAISSHRLGLGGGFRLRLGETNSPKHGLAQSAGRQAWLVASTQPTALPEPEFDWSSISLWASPVISGVENRIAPLTSKGSVKVAMFGAEHTSEDQVTVLGLVVSRDWLDIDTPYNNGKVTGSGLTLSPYVTMQLNSQWTLDASAGIGQSSVTSKTSTQTSEPDMDRRFVSVGLTHAKAFGKWFVLSKGSFSISNDEVKAFTTSTNQSIDKSSTRLNQMKLGVYALYSNPPVSPFIAVYQVSNDFSVTSTSAQKPREYSSVQQLQVGLNASSGPLYGAVAYQAERGRSQWRIYGGIRY